VGLAVSQQLGEGDVLTPSLPLRCTATGMTGPKPNVQYPVLNSKHHSKYTKLVA